MNIPVKPLIMATLLVFLGWPLLLLASSPLVIVLNADMSSTDRKTGDAIRHGAHTAIDEINSAGGVLGQPLALDILDHRRNPARGVDNVEIAAARDEVIAILGGKHTPVILAELEMIHAYGIPYLIPWAAGTQLTDNDYEPNYVFRVSVRDAYAGGFLVEHAIKQGYRRIGLVLEQTGWGRSNERALTHALQMHGLQPARIEWFNWGERNFAMALDHLRASAVDALIFAGNVPDGINLIRAIAQQPDPENWPVISHWGIIGGDLVEELGADLDRVDLSFLQTFSFLDPPFPERVAAIVERIDPALAADAPSGFAHAYDLIHLLARAITLAGSTERAAVRDALEQIDMHPGLMRDYAPPFTPERHDALDSSDLRMARYIDGVIVPINMSGE